MARSETDKTVNLEEEQRHEEIQMIAYGIKQDYPHVDRKTAWARAETLWEERHNPPSSPNAPGSAKDR